MYNIGWQKINPSEKSILISTFYYVGEKGDVVDKAISPLPKWWPNVSESFVISSAVVTDVEPGWLDYLPCSDKDQHDEVLKWVTTQYYIVKFTACRLMTPESEGGRRWRARKELQISLMKTAASRSMHLYPHEGKRISPLKAAASVALRRIYLVLATWLCRFGYIYPCKYWIPWMGGHTRASDGDGRKTLV